MPATHAWVWLKSMTWESIGPDDPPGLMATTTSPVLGRPGGCWDSGQFSWNMPLTRGPCSTWNTYGLQPRNSRVVAAGTGDVQWPGLSCTLGRVRYAGATGLSSTPIPSSPSVALRYASSSHRGHTRGVRTFGGRFHLSTCLARTPGLLQLVRLHHRPEAVEGREAIARCPCRCWLAARNRTIRSVLSSAPSPTRNSSTGAAVLGSPTPQSLDRCTSPGSLGSRRCRARPICRICSRRARPGPSRRDTTRSQ